MVLNEEKTPLLEKSYFDDLERIKKTIQTNQYKGEFYYDSYRFYYQPKKVLGK